MVIVGSLFIDFAIFTDNADLFAGDHSSKPV